jgi:hypothetical protein
MMRACSIEKRLDALEQRMGVRADPEFAAFQALDDAELELVGEFLNLHKAGFATPEISEMMAERYEAAVAVMYKLDEVYRANGGE